MSKEMSNVYSRAMVDEIVARLSRKYIEKIKQLTNENECLRGRLRRAESKENASQGASSESEASLDMDKILRPDQNLNLENLCKELGLMDDNA
jgi:hypothetical protein